MITVGLRCYIYTFYTHKIISHFSVKKFDSGFIYPSQPIKSSFKWSVGKGVCVSLTYHALLHSILHCYIRVIL